MSRPHQILLSKYVLLILCELCLNYKPQLNYISTRTQTIKNEVQRIMLNSNKEKQTKLHFLYLKANAKIIQLVGTKACDFLINKAELTKLVESRSIIPCCPLLTADNSKLSGGDCTLLMRSSNTTKLSGERFKHFTGNLASLQN